VRPWILVAVLCLALAGCTRSGVFHCSEDDQCGAGRCEATGFCSVPDGNCPGGFGYDDSAGVLAGTCVTGEPGGPDATSLTTSDAAPTTDASVDAAPAPTLARDECAEGLAIPAAHSDCARSVCATLPGCCSLGWDEACVQAVERSATCARSCGNVVYGARRGDLRGHYLTSTGAVDVIGDAPTVHQIAAADYDGDGRVDLALSTQAGWTVLRNESVRSASLWREVARYPNPNTGDGDARRIAWADYDRDGDLDLAVAYERGGLVLVRHDPGADPPFVQVAPALLPTAALDFDWGDVDDDGDLDLVAAHDYEAKILVNDGDGRFTPDDRWRGSAHFGVRFCDVTGDQRPEVVAASYNGELFVYPNEGGLRAAETTVPRVHGEAYGPIACADLDGDGDLDVAAAASTWYLTLRIYRNRGLRQGIEETVAWATTDKVPVFGLDAGDVDGDRDPDLVIAHGDALQLMENTSQGGALSLTIHAPKQAASEYGFDIAPEPARR
jgi:hypothetical protein